MKVARLCRKMRISLTDAEFKALALLVEIGLDNLDTETAMAEKKPVRRHLNSPRFRQLAGPLAVDLDKRGLKP